MANNLLYGGIAYPNTSFSFDYIYENKTSMLPNSDGVLLGRYVMVAYCEAALTVDERYDIETHATAGHTEAKPSWNQDWQDYFTNFVEDGKISYDRTVFRKMFDGSSYYYEEIAKLNSTLSVEGLKIHNVHSEDKILSIDEDKNLVTKLDFTAGQGIIQLLGNDNEEVTTLPLELEFDKTNYYLYLKSNGVIIAGFDATDFIKDSFLQSVEYNTNTNSLQFTFLDAYGEQQVVNTNIDIIDVGNGLQFVEGANPPKLELKLDSTNDNYLSIDDNTKGLKLEDIPTDKIYCPKNIVLAGRYTQIGNITKGELETKTLETENKTLQEVIDMFLTEEDLNLIKSNPSASMTNITKYVEIGQAGEKVDITLTLEDGEYVYGYTSEEISKDGTVVSNIVKDGSTGVQANKYEFDFMEGLYKQDTNTLSLSIPPQISAKEEQISGRITYGKGKTPVSNLKKAYPSKQISEGSAESQNKAAVRWYVPYYKGFIYGIDNKIETMDLSKLSKLSKITGKDAYEMKNPKGDSAQGSWIQYWLITPNIEGTPSWVEMPGAKDENGLTLSVERRDDITITFGTEQVPYYVYVISHTKEYDTKKIVWS